MAHPSGVYFLVCNKTNLCKIGYSSNIITRVRNIQNMCPTNLTCYFIPTEFGKQLEKQLHTRYKTSRRHGEWFNYTKALRSFTENKYKLMASTYQSQQITRENL